MWEKLTKIKVCENFDELSKIMFGLSPPMEKVEKAKNDK